jgi:hypothetical protein
MLQETITTPSSMKRRKVRSEEFQAELNADPAYQARLAKKQAEVDRVEAAGRVEEAPLAADLRAVGYEVESAWDLVNTSTPYPRALPILLQHLERPYSVATREGIARALAVRDGTFAWPVLLALYKREAEPRVKDALAVALSAASNDVVLPELIELVRDPRHGPSRILLLLGLRRTRDTRGMATIIEMADDPDLKLEIHDILKRSKKRVSRARGR